ncbi:MAG: VOC family protein [Steroidobacteraceae bacterium]|jgi:catechol 2,3-dioxygenase-like lactoylglutathione lyase family enzyme|nr:VOC family protein [Steroidobacteraceae bacterium]
MISGIECVTLGVRDLDGALGLFRDVFGYRVESDTRASVSLLSVWGLRPYADVRLVELSCDGYAFGRLRLAQFPDEGPATRDDFGPAAPDAPTAAGPKALDLYVAPPMSAALDVAVRSGCMLRAGPVRFAVRDTETEEALLTGPARLPLLLMVGHRHPKRAQREVPPPGRTSEVATVSVVTADLDATRRFYVDGLGLTADGVDDELHGDDRARVCRLLGVPEDTRVSLVLFRDPAQPSGKVLAVHFHDRTTPTLAHAMRPGNLGISLFSTRCPNLEALRERLESAGTREHLPILHVALGDGMPARTMLARGPNGELFEFIER